jgi:hypothetical protein
MVDIIGRQREVRRRVIRQWMAVQKGKQRSIDEVRRFAKVAAQENNKDFMNGRRSPYAKVMGWLLPRAHLR